jgi:hypothetical protein
VAAMINTSVLGVRRAIWYKLTDVLEETTTSVFFNLIIPPQPPISERSTLSWEGLQAPQVFLLLRAALKIKVSMEHW